MLSTVKGREIINLMIEEIMIEELQRIKEKILKIVSHQLKMRDREKKTQKQKMNSHNHQ